MPVIPEPGFIDILKAIGMAIIGVEMELLLPLVVVVIVAWGARLNWSTKQKKEKIVEYVGFWRRVAIQLLDLTLYLLVVPIAFNLFFYFRDGQTLADKIFRTKIVDKSTHKLASVGQLVVRAITKILSVAGFAGYMVAGWRSEKRAWHDGLSDTRYISVKHVSGWWTPVVIFAGIALWVVLLATAAHIFASMAQ